MVINNSFDFASHIALLVVQDVVIDEGHLVERVSGGELRSELVVEVEIILTDLTVFKVRRDLQVAVEVCPVAVDDWDPLLTEHLLVVEGKDEGSDG